MQKQVLHIWSILTFNDNSQKSGKKHSRRFDIFFTYFFTQECYPTINLHFLRQILVYQLGVRCLRWVSINFFMFSRSTRWLTRIQLNIIVWTSLIKFCKVVKWKYASLTSISNVFKKWFLNFDELADFLYLLDPGSNRGSYEFSSLRPFFHPSATLFSGLANYFVIISINIWKSLIPDWRKFLLCPKWGNTKSIFLDFSLNLFIRFFWSYYTWWQAFNNGKKWRFFYFSWKFTSCPKWGK